MLYLAQFLFDAVLWVLSALVSSSLYGSIRVLVYEYDKPLAFWLRLLIKYPPVLGMESWIEISAALTDSGQLYPLS
jgi:hypothetical protein